jgi:hypothetical protein
MLKKQGNHDPGTGDAETPVCSLPCRPGSALATELPAHMTPGGIRTRDLSIISRSNSDLHHGSWRGVAGNGRCCCRSEEHTQPRHYCRRDSNPRLRTAVAVRRFYRSNRHLHHRPADACASAVERHAGEQATSVSVTATQLRFLRKQTAPGRVQALARPHPGACVKGGNRTRSFHGAKYPKSSPPASV